MWQNKFYNIYSEEEIKEDPEKRDTGLFFFRGDANAKTAITNAGGGFVYVAGIHDSFPHALELSKKGYNAFALIYRPGAQTACEDLARAIAFLNEHANELQIDVTDYSLWGGSAGARMSAWLGSYGTAYFGEEEYPVPAAVIMQYTGLSQITGNEPPTYACVGTSDDIASYRSMENYISKIKQNGTNAEIEVFSGLSHGFGLGEGTVAEGWIDHAVDFWEENMKNLRNGSSTDTVATPDDFPEEYSYGSYVYGTEDPFYDQFERQYEVINKMGIQTGRIVLNGWPHGFGSDGGWVGDYAEWLEAVFD